MYVGGCGVKLCSEAMPSSWPQADNRLKFVEASLNGAPACVLWWGVGHPGGRREGGTIESDGGHDEYDEYMA